MKATCLAVAIYVVMAVGTWGNAYWWATSKCDRFKDESRIWNCEHSAGLTSFFSAVAWPIYISIRLQEPHE